MKSKKLKIYWDFENNVPLILDKSDKFLEIAKDLRPVFLQEKWLLINLFSDRIGKEIFKKSVWATKQNRYIVDGELLD
ncbi:hypothetical protein, partial [Fusobacterium mortiferum]